MNRIQRLMRLLIVATCLLLSTSCGSGLREKVSIESCDDISVMGLSGLKATIGFRNESARRITLSSVSVTLKSGGKSIATLSLKDTIVVERKTQLVEIPTLWRLHNVDPLAAFSASKKIINGDAEGFRVDVKAKAKVGVMNKNLDEVNLSLPDLLKSININAQN